MPPAGCGKPGAAMFRRSPRSVPPSSAPSAAVRSTVPPAEATCSLRTAPPPTAVSATTPEVPETLISEPGKQLEEAALRRSGCTVPPARSRRWAARGSWDRSAGSRRHRAPPGCRARSPGCRCRPLPADSRRARGRSSRPGALQRAILDDADIGRRAKCSPSGSAWISGACADGQRGHRAGDVENGGLPVIAAVRDRQALGQRQTHRLAQLIRQHGEGRRADQTCSDRRAADSSRAARGCAACRVHRACRARPSVRPGRPSASSR